MWVPNTITVVCTGTMAAAGIICLIKDHFTGQRYNKKQMAYGKVAIVTGANAGMGREAALEFAHRGAKVFMACRDMVKCESARRDIVLESENKYVYCRPCDLASQQSIREFVERFKSEEPKLHILVNNAGIMGGPRSQTKEGIELQLGVNHMGHFLLTNLLLPIIKESAPSRIVIVTSYAHLKGEIHKDDLNLANNYDPEVAYNQSKLANILFSNELATRLLGTKVTVNAVNPGLVSTNLERNTPFAKSYTRFFIKPFFWFVTKYPRMGAQGIVHAALEPRLERVTGEYFVDMRIAPQCEKAQDVELAQWLWKVSEKWTHLDQLEVAAAK